MAQLLSFSLLCTMPLQEATSYQAIKTRLLSEYLKNKDLVSTIAQIFKPSSSLSAFCRATRFLIWRASASGANPSLRCPGGTVWRSSLTLQFGSSSGARLCSRYLPRMSLCRRPSPNYVCYRLGTSSGGQELVALHLGLGIAEDEDNARPWVKFVGNIHGDEPSGRCVSGIRGAV